MTSLPLEQFCRPREQMGLFILCPAECARNSVPQGLPSETLPGPRMLPEIFLVGEILGACIWAVDQLVALGGLCPAVLENHLCLITLLLDLLLRYAFPAPSLVLL